MGIFIREGTILISLNDDFLYAQPVSESMCCAAIAEVVENNKRRAVRELRLTVSFSLFTSE